MAIWTIQAKRQLRHGLARMLCHHNQEKVRQCLQPLRETMQQLDEILAATFTEVTSIVVRDVMIGFRRKHDQHILLVEVEDADRGGTYVVKIGSVEKLGGELHGWECCRPAGLRHDMVLLPLSKGCQVPTVGGAEWMSLIYGDAQQFIGVEQTVSLEDAFLDAIQYGNPTLSSTTNVLVEMLERLGHLLYTTSFIEDPVEADYIFRMPRVLRGIGLWNRDPFCLSIRVATGDLVNHGVSRFIDPVDYFSDWVLAYFPHEVEDQAGKVVIQPAVEKFEPPPETSAAAGETLKAWLSQPQPHDLVPYLLRGCAHGDLHGRNVLVGLVHDRALWPTVYDYEDMGPCNLCGWDFVKLESELKIRAYRDILPHEEKDYVHAIRDSEVELNEKTEKYHLDGAWEPVIEQSEPLQRLRVALLEIRRMASLHLGRLRGRAKQWLEEYYFLLAAYGINTADYANLERRELIAAYVSAGVAASRLSWPCRRGPEEGREFGF